MGAQLPGVVGPPLGAHRLVGGLHRLDVAGERHLGIDDHLPAVGQGDDEVGADAGALVVDRRRLLDEVAVLQQPGDLDHPAKLHLAPAAAHVRGAQGGDQRGRLVLQLRRGLADGAHLLAQLTVGRGAVALDAGEQAVQVVQRLVHRFQAGVVRTVPGQQRDHAQGGGGGQQRPEEEPEEQGSGVHGGSVPQASDSSG